MGTQQLYLIDATAFCYRAFYAVRGLSTSFGQPTNAIFGFLNIFQKILKEKQPQLLAVCFDVSRETFRQKKFAAYKIQRPPAPDDLISQIPFIKRIIAAYGIPVVEKDGFEADDVIATLAAAARKKGIDSVIVSADKDILQLVDEKTLVVSPGKNGDVIYDRAGVMERFGVAPGNIVDIIALMGDGIDNIPGVPGIGEKTAAGLIREFGDVESLFRNIGAVKQEKTRAALIAARPQIDLSRELAVLDSRVPLAITIDDLAIGKPDYKELFNIFNHLEFKKFLKDLPAEAPVPEAAAGEIGEPEFRALMKGRDTLFLAGTGSADLVMCFDGECFRVAGAPPALKSILADAGVRKIGHDLKSLNIALAREGQILAGMYFDTMIAAYVLNPGRGSYDLCEIACAYLDEPAGGNPGGVRSIELIRRLYGKLQPQMANDGLEKLFRDVEMPLVEVLADMEKTGIALDTGVLAGLSRDIEKRLITLVQGIYRASGEEFNINSPKQLREVLFERLKLPVVKRTKTGPSTDEEVLSQLAGKHELPAMLLEYRQLTKLKNTYIDALPALVDPRTRRLHTSFNQTGTETGRLSSSNPNLQNIPIKTDIGRSIRGAITASDVSRYLVSCDYSQIELRILAHLSKDECLIEAFRADKDIHKATAALIFGVEENDVDGRMRDTAKRVNFGIIYGLTSYGLSRDLKISPGEAQAFIDAYFIRYPGVRTYIDGQIEQARSQGYVTTLLGRRRLIPQINDKNQAVRQFAQRQAVNTPVQGSAADLIKLAMLAIHRDLAAAGYSTRMVLQVHDELVFDTAAGEMDELCALVKERMEHTFALDVPVKVDIKKGKDWLQMEEVR